MTDIEKYNDAFVEVFGVDNSVLNNGFSKESVEAWDSVHQLNIIALLEESFDVMFDRKILWNLLLMARGVKFLKKYDVNCKFYFMARWKIKNVGMKGVAMAVRKM